MPFKFKLARRLARSRIRAALGALAALTACEPGASSLTDPIEARDPVVALVGLPDSVTLDSLDTKQFQAFGLTRSGDSVSVDVHWSANDEDGEITPGGVFAPGPVTGTFHVFSKLLAGVVGDTSRVPVRASEAPPAGAGAEVSASGDTVRARAVARDTEGSFRAARAGEWPSTFRGIPTHRPIEHILCDAQGAEQTLEPYHSVGRVHWKTIGCPADFLACGIDQDGPGACQIGVR